MFAALTVILLHYALAKRREAVCSFVTFKEGNIYIKVSNQFLIVTLEDILFAVLFDLPTGFKLGYCFRFIFHKKTDFLVTGKFPVVA